MAYAIVRVRGHAKIQRKAVDTMQMMRLNRVNHCVVLKDFVTWGELGHEAIARLLFQRGEIVGGDRLTDAHVKDNSKFPSILDFAKALDKGEAKMGDVKGLKPVVRLHPPMRGYESTRKSYVDGGALGYRGKNIEKLIDRMLEKPKEGK
jgi:large subunit ribosomal protein L30